MNIYLRIFVMTISILVFTVVVVNLIKKRISESDSLLWFFISVVTLFAGLFPDSVTYLATKLKIDYPPTLLFLFSTFVLMFIVYKNNTNIALLNARNRELAIQVSILNREIEQLKCEKQ